MLFRLSRECPEDDGMKENATQTLEEFMTTNKMYMI